MNKARNSTILFHYSYPKRCLLIFWYFTYILAKHGHGYVYFGSQDPIRVFDWHPNKMIVKLTV